jgi:plastocyanin
MRIRFRPLLLVAALGLSPKAAATIIDVAVLNYEYTGQYLTIKLGDTVRWTNTSSLTHTVTEGEDYVLNGNEAFHKSLAVGSPSFSVTFDAAFLAQWPRPGNRYGYFCVQHSAAMRGSITVETGPGDFFCFCSPIGPCSNRDYGAGCVNSGNRRGARMMGAGTLSVATDDLQLNVDLLPPNKDGIYFRGQTLTAQTPLGDGWRCISGPLVRYGAQNSGSAGMAPLGPGILADSLTSASPMSVGETWLYQFWYRDTNHPCGTMSNVSNGYAVTFAP